MVRYNGDIVPFADDAQTDERTIFGDVTESDDIDLNLNADYKRGWRGVVGLNDKPPVQWFNALGYTVSSLVAYLYQMGISEWNTSQKYRQYSRVIGSNGKLYKAKTGTDSSPNTGNNPISDSINWEADGELDINSLTSKTTPIDADTFVIADSASSNVLKKLTWANLKQNIDNSTNLLINPNFKVNQRSYVSGTNTTIANQYCHDRWRVVVSGQNVTFTTTAGIVTVTAPAGGYEQIIENINNIGGKYSLSNKGTATTTVSQSADNITYTPVGANADGSYTINGGYYVKINFANGTIITPQFELGTVVTPFENRNFALELVLCKRYFEQLVDALLSGTVNINSIPRLRIQFSSKRVTPTLSVNKNSGFPKISDFSNSDITLTTKELTFVELSVDAGVIGFNQAVFSNGKVIHGQVNNLLLDLSAEL